MAINKRDAIAQTFNESPVKFLAQFISTVNAAAAPDAGKLGVLQDIADFIISGSGGADDLWNSLSPAGQTAISLTAGNIIQAKIDRVSAESARLQELKTAAEG